MKIYLLSIGNELLYGSIANTNAQFLSKELTNAGLLVNKIISVKDEKQIMLETIRGCLVEADIVIVTGGLGPTFDDVTREVLCEVFHVKPRFFPEVAADLKKRYGESLETIEDQSTQPDKATILPNKWGTAPGLLFHENNKVVIALPGVPSQMKQIFSDEALPKLKTIVRVKDTYITKEIHFALIGEQVLDPLIRKLIKQYPTIDFGIYPSYGTVTVRLIGKMFEQDEMSQIIVAIQKEFSSSIFSLDEGRIEKVFHQKMIEKGYTLAIAESCTGGHFASRLTAIPDASKYFLGSMVTYSNEAKQSILKLDQSILAKHGAVSRACVMEMAQGIIDSLNPDIVIAVSGIAGPSGGTKEKPVGTVWVCFGKKGHLRTELVPVRGVLSRELIIDYTVNWILAKLLMEII